MVSADACEVYSDLLYNEITFTLPPSLLLLQTLSLR